VEIGVCFLEQRQIRDSSRFFVHGFEWVIGDKKARRQSSRYKGKVFEHSQHANKLICVS
jgi:hypothetical protein